MNEVFLQFLWQNALIRFHELTTIDGQAIVVIDRGVLNKNAGPDFLNARIKIGDTLWAGHIELHVKTSQWLQHQHQNDPKYQNVILHVVWEHDKAIAINNIPTTELLGKYDEDYWQHYQALMHQETTLLCHKQLSQVPEIIISKYKETMLFDRWEAKEEALNALMEAAQQDWRQKCYVLLAKAFGFKINQDAFEQLALRTPLAVLEKHKDNQQILEAILIGQSGLIPETHQDTYTQQLEKEYNFLRRKYDLKPIQAHLWNYAKLRPANFPLIRIAQFAHLLFAIQFDFEQLIIKEKSVLNYLKSLQITASSYFETHYKLSHTSLSASPKHLGSMGIQHLIINAIAPLRFWYSKLYNTNKVSAYDTALEVLTQIPAEINHKTKMWPLPIEHAFDSQSVVHLINNKCSKKACLQCGIGNFILKKLK